MSDQPSSQAVRTRPGRKQGHTGELTTIWQVKKGHEAKLRATLEQLDKWPIEQKGNAGALIGTLHDRRWVLFDDDTRMLFATNYDGEWDPYIEAFAEHNAEAFNIIFEHIEGWPEKGLRDPTVFDYIIDHQVTALEYMRFYDGTVQEIQSALRVKKAFDELAADPKFQSAVRDPALAGLVELPAFQAVLDEAAG